jgi:hypothetical protein
VKWGWSGERDEVERRRWERRKVFILLRTLNALCGRAESTLLLEP